MGKASRWFRGLLGLNKPDPNPPFSKKKWSFSRAHKERRDPHQQPLLSTAEAAVAAAQAAAAVVELTSSSTAGSGGGCNSSDAVSLNREERAAVTIQSHFRAYLARRALRALKALIKLQAVAKGYIFRKQFGEYLRQMQAVERAQARLRAGRVSNSEASNSSTKSSGFDQNLQSSATRENFDDAVDRTKRRQRSTLERNGLKSNGGANLVRNDPKNPHYSVRSRWMSYEQQRGSSARIIPMDDGRTDKILEVDPGKPTRVYRNTFHSSHDLTDQSWSPQCYSASSVGGGSKKGPTPTKSDGSYYLDHPSYMAYTESSKAKVRSVSAPRQRFQEERSSSMNRYSVHGFGNNSNESRVNSVQKVAALHASFTSKAYPGSGRLDGMGMPVRDVLGFTGGHWQRFY